ncbi:glycosyltransferase [Virgibacillus sp. L01]|uniref:glycosyltransferase n=1 Tax=Virgibacillus sp. L01 TaxID=3457429 RepID=UPI003FD1B74E
MKKKVAFFIPSLNFGGIEANTIRLATAFSKNGYDVDLIVGRAQGGYIDRIPSNINIIDFKRDKVYKTIPQLNKYMRSAKPDAVISGGEAPNITLIIAKMLTLKVNTKIIVSIRTHLTTELRRTRIFNKKVLKYLGKILYHFADEVVAVSKGVAEDASLIFGLDKEKVKVIYNPIVDGGIAHNSNKQLSHPWLNDKKVPVLLGAGRLVPQKNFALLVKAFSIVCRLVDVKLVIVGEGPEKDNLERAISDLELNGQVDLVGYQPNPYVYMKRSDVFVLSSDWEGFGNVIVEAMACGLKIVSTNCPSGPSEILDHGNYGYLVDTNNPELLADAILQALEESFNSEVNISRANHFSVKNAMTQYKHLIEKV